MAALEAAVDARAKGPESSSSHARRERAAGSGKRGPDGRGGPATCSLLIGIGLDDGDEECDARPAAWCFWPGALLVRRGRLGGRRGLAGSPEPEVVNKRVRGWWMVGCWKARSTDEADWWGLEEWPRGQGGGADEKSRGRGKGGTWVGGQKT